METIQDRILAALKNPSKAKAPTAQTATATASQDIAKYALAKIKRERTLAKWSHCVKDVMQRSNLDFSQVSAIVKKFETLANQTANYEKAFVDICELYSAFEDVTPELERAKKSFI